MQLKVLLLINYSLLANDFEMNINACAAKLGRKGRVKSRKALITFIRRRKPSLQCAVKVLEHFPSTASCSLVRAAICRE